AIYHAVVLASRNILSPLETNLTASRDISFFSSILIISRSKYGISVVSEVTILKAPPWLLLIFLSFSRDSKSLLIVSSVTEKNSLNSVTLILFLLLTISMIFSRRSATSIPDTSFKTLIIVII